MRACNSTSQGYTPECCGLQCLDSCWTRKLNVDELGVYNGSVVGNTTSDNKLPPIRVSLLRAPPYSAINSTEEEERDSPTNVYVAAVLESECSTPTTPWDCPSTNLVSGRRVLADTVTGQAVFPAIELDSSLASGEYSVILYAESYSSEDLTFKYGGLTPPLLFASSGWPYATAGPFVHVKDAR